MSFFQFLMFRLYENILLAAVIFIFVCSTIFYDWISYRWYLIINKKWLKESERIRRERSKF